MPDKGHRAKQRKGDVHKSDAHKGVRAAPGADRHDDDHPRGDDHHHDHDDDSPSLAQDELAAGTGLLATHGRLVRALDSELKAAHGLALVEFQALASLDSAGGTLRMTDLAASCSLSRSGLTRVVGVLARQDLVSRTPDAGDGRVVRATLSELGRTRLGQAATTRDAALRRFFAPLLPKQTRALARAWAALD